MEPSLYTAKILSSLEKVFPDTEPTFQPECSYFTALKDETFSFQVAYTCNERHGQNIRVAIHSPLGEKIRLRKVALSPVNYPCHGETDDHYLRTTPGLYPDLLQDVVDGKIFVSPKHWHALWLDVEVTPDTTATTYPIDIIFTSEDGTCLTTATTALTVLDATLPKQTLIRTEWFHADCLSNYYQVEPLSEAHWEIIENFVAIASKRGMNMLLTPLFTPPLDTAVGKERTTIQLVDVTLTEGVYHFNFDKLTRWINMAQNVGIQYFEMSHLFTQWGAEAAPKIMATVDGTYKRILGWDTPATGAAYTSFLSQFLPALTNFLHTIGIAKQTYFHISDEPSLEQLDSYVAAKEVVAPYLEGFTIIDALSNYAFYADGVVAKPIPASNHIDTFLENGVPNLWVYYCTSQYLNTSNRFMSMPSARTRIYGTQLFKYDIEGSLHWGYNFYNAQFSTHAINPYLITDAAGTFPAGDGFLVYPGPNGVPEESIRMMTFYQGLCDLRAMQLLASLTSKDYVLELIEGELSTPLTFSCYPKSAHYLLALRNKINRECARLSTH